MHSGYNVSLKGLDERAISNSHLIFPIPTVSKSWSGGGFGLASYLGYSVVSIPGRSLARRGLVYI